MSLANTDHLSIITESARDFAEKFIRPDMMEWDESQHFPVELFHKAGELGLMGVLVPEVYGGAGLGYTEYVNIIVEIASVCGSIGLSVAAHNSLCTGHIYNLVMKNRNKCICQNWLRPPGLVPGD